VLSVLWHVSGENVVETAIFSNNYNDVLDGSASAYILLGLKGPDERATRLNWNTVKATNPTRRP